MKRPQSRGARWPLIVYVVVAVIFGYNVVTTLWDNQSNGKVTAVVLPNTNYVKQTKSTHPETAQSNVLAPDDEPAHADATPVAAVASPPPSTPTEAPLLHCFDLQKSTPTTGAEKLCHRHLRHLAAVAVGLAKDGQANAALVACADTGAGCAEALAATTSGSALRFAASAGVEKLWSDARLRAATVAKPINDVTAKYSPLLWHNLISWAPQPVAAAYREIPADPQMDPYDDRRAWRHGKREPGVHSKLSGNLIPRTNAAVQEAACEEQLPAIHFAPYSDLVRVLYEAELALQEVAQATPSTAFEPLTSFHTTWAFPAPRKCAIDRLNGSSHPAITTNSVAAFGPGGAWIGFVDNTTGLTETTRALRRIVALVTKNSGSKKAMSWSDFVWKELPKLSPAIARHLLRVISTYNPWMGLTAFTSCAVQLSGLLDAPVVTLPVDLPADAVHVPAPLTPARMAAVADCSTDPVSPSGDECPVGQVSAELRSLFGDGVGAHRSTSVPRGRRIIGALPRLLCVFTVGVTLTGSDGKPQASAFASYHATAADYLRTSVGGCTRSLIIIAISAPADAVKSANSWAALHQRAGPSTLPSGDGDALLRQFGVDVVADFPLVDAAHDIIISIDSSPPAEDRAWRIGLHHVFAGDIARDIRATNRRAEAFRYVDGVPRHTARNFFDVIAFVPSGVGWIPQNVMRFFLRRDVTAATYVMNVPRLYAHPAAAVVTKSPTTEHRLIIVDADMFLLLQPTLYTKTCPISDADPIFDFWRCVRRLKLKITYPTEQGRHLMISAAQTSATSVGPSPFAFAAIDENPSAIVQRWGRS